MVDEKLLAILRCPNDRSALRAANREIVDQLNASIRDGRIRNRAGGRVDRQLGGGLIRAQGDLLYPIVDHIPVMLYDEAIPLDQLGSTS